MFLRRFGTFTERLSGLVELIGRSGRDLRALWLAIEFSIVFETCKPIVNSLCVRITRAHLAVMPF